MNHMRRAAVLFALLFTLCGAVALHAQRAAPSQPQLKIYVAPIEGYDHGLADMVTAKVISYLVKHGVSVVESEEDADETLTGAGMMQTWSDDYGKTHYHLQAGMRLTNKDGKVVWADDVASSKFAQSATSSFADNVAKSISKALPDKKP